MKAPPSIIRFRIDGTRRHFGLWFPLFLLWPLAAAIIIVLLPLALLLALVLWHRRLLMVGPVILSFLCSLHGLEIDFQRSRGRFLFSLK
jgi:hypothetical protein